MGRYDVSPILQPHLQSPSTLWTKFARPRAVISVGRDILCVHNGRQLLLHNLVTREERALAADADARGDGVACAHGHSCFPLLAYAERRERPRVFLVRAADGDYAHTLGSNFAQLTALLFSDMDLLFGFSGYPECAIVVWKWKTAEIMNELPTGMFFDRNCVLEAAHSAYPIIFAQLLLGTNRIKMWEAACCGKRCVMSSEDVVVACEDPRLQIHQLAWSAEAVCFAIDTGGNVYRYDYETHVMHRVIAACAGEAVACFCWWKGGLLVQGADQTMRHYSPQIELEWEAPLEQQFERMVAPPEREHLVAVTRDQELLLFDAESKTYAHLRTDEARITHVGLVPPQHEHLVTLARGRRLSLWAMATGGLLHALALDAPATCLAASPVHPYVALTFESGCLRLYGVLVRPEPTLQQLCVFLLSTAPLEEVKFFEQGRLVAAVGKERGEVFVVGGAPGGRFKVLAGITHRAQIVDYVVVGASACLKVFLLPETSGKYLAGNRLVRYCVLRRQQPVAKTFELENAERMYTALYVVRDQASRDRFLYATPLESKNLHELELKRGDTHARIVNRYGSHHMLRHIRFHFAPTFVLSHGYDGIVIVRDARMEALRHVVVPHHHLDGGVLAACYDPHRQRVVTLGREGVLVCSELVGAAAATPAALALLDARSEELADMFKTPTVGFDPKGIFAGVCWLEYAGAMKIEAERVEFHEQRQRIVDTLRAIKRRAVVLLDHNLSGPANERLELQDFNLDLQRKEDLIRASMFRCDRLKVYLEMYVQDMERISAAIKAVFWDSIAQPTRNLWAIFANFGVQSYAVPPPDGGEQEALARICSWREVERFCAKEDSFKPWTYFSEEEKDGLRARAPRLYQEQPLVAVNLSVDDEDDTSETYLQEREDELETEVAFFGSALPLYVQLEEEAQYEQAEAQTFLQHGWTYAISKDQQQQLRECFNKDFEQVVELKAKEIANVVERNARLRYIVDEMNYFSAEQFDISPPDPVWQMDETPELIVRVDDAELGVRPYVSPSEQALADARAAEEERLRLLLLADDFKERALMKMMNGVLEVRWEDELRHDVAKPKCMLEKAPEDYTEEDLRLIRDYEEQVAFLASERNRYKGILVAEYNKVGGQLREGVRRFNERVKELLARKLQVESALADEMLRMHRLRLAGWRRNQANRAVVEAEQEIAANDRRNVDLGALVAGLNVYDAELKEALDAYLVKDRIAEKAFKREFQDCTPAQYDLLLKLFKKRPRVSFKVNVSASTVMEMACSVAADTKSKLLFGDPLDYLVALSALDRYAGLPSYVDEAMFSHLVRVRRNKIEMELRVRACQMEINEAEGTKQLYRAHHAKVKEHGLELLATLDQLRAKRVQDTLDIELQLVLRQGLVELPRAGGSGDFADAVLVNRKDVEDINAVIQETGARKIKAMRSALQFRKEIMIKEWQHTKRKMEIADLEHELVDIGSIKLTKEIQAFLKMRSKGFPEKIVSFENELEELRKRYQRQISQRRAEVTDLEERLADLTAENDRLNREIQLVNIDVCEGEIQVDGTIDAREVRFINMRIRSNLKRSRMVNQIQVNHNDILVLQAELELCRLRTIPILDYKVDE